MSDNSIEVLQRAEKHFEKFVGVAAVLWGRGDYKGTLLVLTDTEPQARMIGIGQAFEGFPVIARKEVRFDLEASFSGPTI